MDLTPTQLDILYRPKMLGVERGQVLEAWAFPAAHALAAKGWLGRRLQPDGEMSWWWTAQAETALDLNDLLTSAQGRQN